MSRPSPEPRNGRGSKWGVLGATSALVIVAAVGVAGVVGGAWSSTARESDKRPAVARPHDRHPVAAAPRRLPRLDAHTHVAPTASSAPCTSWSSGASTASSTCPA